MVMSNPLQRKHTMPTNSSHDHMARTGAEETESLMNDIMSMTTEEEAKQPL